MRVDQTARVAVVSGAVTAATGGGREGREDGLRRRAIRGTLWWAGIYPLQKVIQVVSSAILARLLFPEAFGLLSLGNSVMQGLRMFSELGLRPAMLSHTEGDTSQFVNTAWTLQVVRGVALCLIAGLLAWPVARFYNEAVLLWLVPGLAFVSMVNAFRSTSLITLNRKLNEKPAALLELVQSLVTRGGTIVLAWLHPSVMSLVGGSLLGAGVFVIGSHRLIPGFRNRFAWDSDAARSLFGYGTWILIGTIIAFFGQQIDKLMLPRLETFGMLGVYSIAGTLATLPREMISVIISKIMFPVMCETARGDIRDLGKRVLRIRRSVLPVSLWATLGSVLAAPWFFYIVYDSRYADACWISPLISVGIWIQMLNGSVCQMLLALGRPKVLAVTGLLRLIITTAACLAGFYWLGLVGFVLGVAVGFLGEHLWHIAVLRRHGIAVHLQDVAYTSALILLAGLAIGSDQLGRHVASLPLGLLLRGGVPLTILAATTLWALRTSAEALFPHRKWGRWASLVLPNRAPDAG